MTIHEAVRAGDIIAVRDHLANEPTAVHTRNDLGWTPLHLAAAQGEATSPLHAIVAALLLEAGADVNARDVVGQTPVHLIAMNGSVASIPVARVLLSHGADLRVRSAAGLDWHNYWQHGREVHELLSGADRREV